MSRPPLKFKHYLTQLAVEPEMELEHRYRRGLEARSRWRAGDKASVDTVREVVAALDAAEEMRRRRTRRAAEQQETERRSKHRTWTWLGETLEALRPLAELSALLTVQDKQYFADERLLVLGKGTSLRVGDLHRVRRLINSLTHIQNSQLTRER